MNKFMCSERATVVCAGVMMTQLLPRKQGCVGVFWTNLKSERATSEFVCILHMSVVYVYVLIYDAGDYWL